ALGRVPASPPSTSPAETARVCRGHRRRCCNAAAPRSGTSLASPRTEPGANVGRSDLESSWRPCEPSVRLQHRRYAAEAWIGMPFVAGAFDPRASRASVQLASAGRGIELRPAIRRRGCRLLRGTRARTPPFRGGEANPPPSYHRRYRKMRYVPVAGVRRMRDDFSTAEVAGGSTVVLCARDS